MTEQEALQKMVAPGQKRPHIWRGGIVQVHVTRACDKACFGCTQGSNLGGKPVIITPEAFEEALVSLKGYWGVVGVFGGNPCVAAGTKVYTTKGIFPVEDLEGKVFNVNNQRGESQLATCWHSGSGRQLYRVTLRGGHEYYATADHEWPALSLEHGQNSRNKQGLGYDPRKQVVSLGKVQTKDLTPGMRLPVAQKDSLGFGDDGDADDGFLAGWILGDGWITGGEEKTLRTRNDGQPDQRSFRDSSGSHRVRHVGMIVSEVDHANGIQARLSDKLADLGSLATWRAVKKCHEITVATVSMNDWMDRFGLIGKRVGLPLAVWDTASEEFRRGLIDGLFSADGNVEVSKGRKYVRVRLVSAHEQLVRDVSELLGFYGIKTQINVRVRPGKFPNKKDYAKEYTSYTLSICDVASVSRFAKLFPLTHTEKNARLQQGDTREPDVESNNIEIVSVEPTDRYEDVWDISVADDTHTFQLAHCITGNCLHPKFELLCEILRKHFPREQCGLWCNHPKGKGAIMRRTFDPAVSNLNVHLDQEAYDEFWAQWPECRKKLKGLDSDSRHSPPFVAMNDVGVPEERRWELISGCDINQNWSAMICQVPGKGLRTFFCEIAGAMAMLHADDPDWPDNGLPATPGWWQKPMTDFADQVRHNCHRCGIPLRRFGQLAVDGEYEEVSATHQAIYKPKQPNRRVSLVTVDEEENRRLRLVTNYVENGSLK